MLINRGKDPTVLQTRSYEITQDPRESYKIVEDSLQNPKESTTILDKMLQHLKQQAKNLVKTYTSANSENRRFKKDPMESLANLKILQDNRQDPMQSCKILQKFYGILTSSGKAPTVLQTRSYEILQDHTLSYKIVQDPVGLVWDLREG